MIINHYYGQPDRNCLLIDSVRCPASSLPLLRLGSEARPQFQFDFLAIRLIRRFLLEAWRVWCEALRVAADGSGAAHETV